MKLPAGHVAGQGVIKPTGYGGLGERLLRGMGWEKGQGLGKEGDGMKQAIEVKKKEDTAGIGGTQSYQWENKWWESAFDSAVQTLGTAGSDSSSDSSDDEDDAGGGGAPAIHNRDGTLTSASVDELKLQAALSKGGRLAAGRFGGRDGKMARIRAQEAKQAAEAAALLGPAAAPAGGSDRSDTTSDAHAAGEGAAAANGAAPAAKRQRIVIEPVVVSAAPQYEFRPTQLEGWWGAKMFAPAGCLEGMEKDVKRGNDKERAAFDEDEQARIWTAAQAGKTQGKVGLGQGTGTVKVGGVKWAGSKVTFGEEPAAEDASKADEPAAKAAKAARKKKLAAAGSSTHLAQLEAGDSEAAAAEPAWAAAVKWKKLLARTLSEKGSGGELALKALQVEVLSAVKERAGGASRKEVRAVVLSKLSASSRFVVDGKLVRLKA